MTSDSSNLAPVDAPPLWQPIVLAAMGGGMAWGIRGQYGHESGAMLAGLLMGFALMLLFCRRANSLAAARAVALCTVAIGFGGSETYAQSVGLTKDPEFVGNWAALQWGLLGLAIKGLVWVGFAGVFLGIGLGGVRYRSREMFLVMLGLLALHLLGVRLFNRPFDADIGITPPIFFSFDGHWATDEFLARKPPRREMWGGLLAALAGLLAYTRFVRGDRLAWRMGWWAILGGAIGFPLAQSLQAWQAWNPEFFSTGFAAKINWWNFMETGFGCFMGAVLGLGLWLNRRRIALPAREPATTLSPVLEIALLLIHAQLLVSAEFFVGPLESFYRRAGWEYGTVSWYTGLGYFMAIVPLVGIIGGRWWPYLQVFLVTAIPIAGKTLRNLGVEEHAISIPAGAALYVALPLLLALAITIHYARRRSDIAQPFLAGGLLFCTWLYFALNFAFFRYPWPWLKWTDRTPNALVFLVCAAGLTWLALSRPKWVEGSG